MSVSRVDAVAPLRINGLHDIEAAKNGSAEPRTATVELGENIQATCPTATQGPAMENKAASKADLSSLSSMLEARWKGGASGLESRSGEIRKGQVRSFRIARLDPASKKIELELA